MAIARVVSGCVLALALASGCKDRPKAGGAAASGSGSAAAVAVLDGGAPSPDGHAAARRARPDADALTRAEVETFVDGWLADQTGGDFTAYAARYAPGFHGVRRSGKQVVALDHDGWLRERKRMFAKPMVVAVREREIALAGATAHVQFVQDWASGSYHDVGAKIMDVAKQGGVVRITSEQLLASQLIVPAGGADRLPLPLLVSGELVILDDEATGWSKPHLDGGRVPNAADICEDTPDYEDEQDAYWACYNADPKNIHDRYVASAKLTRIAKELSAPVQVWSAAGPVCAVTPADFVAYGEWSTAASELLPQLAQAVLERTAVTAARLPATCAGGVFALPVTAAAPALWTIGPAPAKVQDAAAQALAAIPGIPTLDALEAPKQSVWSIAPPAGAAGAPLVLIARDGAQDCQTDGHAYALFALGGTADHPELTALASDPSAAAQLRAAPDVDGDGHPELVLAGALLTWDEGAYSSFAILDFPDESPRCYCECE